MGQHLFRATVRDRPPGPPAHYPMARSPSRIPRLAPALAALVSITCALPAYAQFWTPSGVPVCSDTCRASAPLVTSDGAGGVYVAWRESRANADGYDDVFVQRLAGGGAVAPGWLPAGMRYSAETICTSPVRRSVTERSPSCVASAV